MVSVTRNLDLISQLLSARREAANNKIIWVIPGLKLERIWFYALWYVDQLKNEMILIAWFRLQGVLLSSRVFGLLTAQFLVV